MGLLDKLSKKDDDDKPKVAKTGSADLAAAAEGGEGSEGHLIVDPAYWGEHDPPVHRDPSELEGEAADGGSGKKVLRGDDLSGGASEYGAPGEEGGPGGEEGGPGQGGLRNPGGTGSPGGVPEGV